MFVHGMSFILLISPLVSAVLTSDVKKYHVLFARQNLPTFQPAAAAKVKLTQELAKPVYCTESTERAICGIPQRVCSRMLNICLPVGVDTFYGFQRIPETNGTCPFLYSSVMNEGELKHQHPTKCLFTGPKPCEADRDCPQAHQRCSKKDNLLGDAKRCWTGCTNNSDCGGVSGSQCREGVCYI